LLKAWNGSVYKLFSDFYHLNVVNSRMYRLPRISQSSGFYSNIYTHTLFNTHVTTTQTTFK
jgi:hypothetical protein